MRCSACDTANPPEAMHCMKCGKKLAAGQPRPVPEEEPRPRRASRSEAIEERKPRRRPADDDYEDEEYERRPRRRPAARRHDDDDDEYDASDDGGISTLIPYKNLRALFSYYAGIGALIPVLGLLLAPVAMILGILGLLYRRDHPEAKGTAHAIVGIVLGTLSLLCQSIGSLILWKFK
jgi:hypothetical protein